MFLSPPSMIKGATKLKSISKSLPVPTKGWNTRDNIAAMDQKCAVLLDNLFPDSDRVTPRKGSLDYATGMSGNVDTLMVYTPQSGSAKMFAANGTNIYNVSSTGAVGAAMLAAQTSARYQYLNMGTSGGHFLIAFNGADVPIVYNGTVWSTTGITGPTLANLIWGNLHQKRLWTGEKDSLTAYYGATNAISGAFTAFPLAGIAQKGGYIMGMVTWTRDAGSGQDDVAVFVTSEGEAIVYKGTDPSADTTWSLIGVFQIGKPIGRRFYVKAGGDAVLVTEDGFVSLATVLGSDRAQVDEASISSQINKTVNQAVQATSGSFGWQPVLHPRGTMLFFNVPIDSLTSHQYVFNTLTQAPCRYKGWNANCWAVFNDNIYYGSKNGKVVKANTGNSDNGVTIATDCLPAFNYLGYPGRLKIFQLAKVIYQSDGEVSTALDLNTDFSQAASSALSSTIASGAAKWDEALWDGASWGGADDIYQAWKSVRGKGDTASLRVRTQSTTSRPSMLAIRLIFQLGGYI